MTTKTPYEALLLVLDRVRTQAELARICDVSTTAVWKWKQSSKRVPAEFVIKIEEATGVSRHDLRPDIYPRERMVDGIAGLHCDLATGHNGFVTPHDCQHSDRFHGVDFKRGLETKAAGQ